MMLILPKSRRSLGRRFRDAGRVLATMCIVAASGAIGLAAPPATPRAVMDRYCLGCHNDRVRSAGLSLTVSTAKSPAERPEIWEKVARKLIHRHMPPMGMPRPDEATYKTVIASIVEPLDEAAAKAPNPGRVPAFRRLSRFEYRNAIRDLLAVDIDVQSLLPVDEASHGFDNITVSDLTPTLLERYLAAARKISRLAIGVAPRSPTGDTVLIPPDLTQEGHIEGLPLGTRGGAAIRYNFPVDGHYELQIRLTRDRDERVEGLNDPHTMELTIDGERVRLFTIKPVPRNQPHHLVDKDFNVRAPLKAGQHEIAVSFLRKTSALVEAERQPYQARFNADRHPRQQPALYSIAVVGPFDVTGRGESASRRSIFSCVPSSASEESPCAEKILSSLARRAWRRPVAAREVQPLMKFYAQGRAEGGFDTGIEMALRALLASPNFLLRTEKETPQVSDVELASRLSFFLWSSIPDEELLNAAESGRLREPAVLEKQVRRMLGDRRASALVTNFASQWLYLRNLESAYPDLRLFPDFDENLRQAFRRETEMFVDSVIREDRSVLDLLRADYTYLNERLAKHYGIPNVYGSRFRRVQLGNDGVRRGLLSHGSILTVTSYATRTSPVVRGKWILTNLLGMPPAPPPPEVPQLKEKSEAGKVLTMRERVAMHRANPACASCHNLMDPVGFALENFDAVGRWRTHDEAMEVDASGTLPDGTKFTGANELQLALLRRPELFASAFTEKLLTYALGRGLEHYDAPAVRGIVRDAARNEYRFSSLVLGIVNSTPFRFRRST